MNINFRKNTNKVSESLTTFRHSQNSDIDIERNDIIEIISIKRRNMHDESKYSVEEMSSLSISQLRKLHEEVTFNKDSKYINHYVLKHTHIKHNNSNTISLKLREIAKRIINKNK